jgi:hypothetical protein
MLEQMPVSFGFLRVMLALIGVACAFMMGRSAAGLRRGSVKKSTFWGWTVRTTACLLAVAFRYGVDGTAIAAWSVGAAVFGLGLWNGSRAREEEDLTDVIFPDGQ